MSFFACSWWLLQHSSFLFCVAMMLCKHPLHDHLRNVNGLIDPCASMITGSYLPWECSQVVWPVARTRRKLFALPIFPSVAGCYHFASIPVLAIVHLTRRMQSVPFVHVPLSEMLQCSTNIFCSPVHGIEKICEKLGYLNFPLSQLSSKNSCRPVLFYTSACHFIQNLPSRLLYESIILLNFVIAFFFPLQYYRLLGVLWLWCVKSYTYEHRKQGICFEQLVGSHDLQRSFPNLSYFMIL